MTCMVFATLKDLADIGAIAANEEPTTLRAQRALGLLEKASSQAAIYLGITDTDDFTEAQQIALATIVAEAAANRLRLTTAPTTDGYETDGGVYTSSLLNRQHYRALDLLFGRAGFGSASITVERDEDSSFFRPYATSSEDVGWWYV